MLRAITRDGLDMLNRYSRIFSVIETTVRNDFEAGHRWAKLLGFRPSGFLRRYDDFGRDYVMYARVSPWDLRAS